MASIFKKAPDPFGGISYEEPAAAPETSGPLGGPYTIDPHQDWIWGGENLRYPRYFDGDQYSPYNWDDGSISGLQAALVAAGFLSAKSMIPGVWDPSSAGALKSALTYANQLGVSLDDLLSRLAGGADAAGLLGGRGGGGGGGGGLGAAAVTDEDIIALANKTAQGVLGRNLRDDEIGNFIPAFRGTLTSGTTPAVSAENLIRQDTAPAESGAHDIGIAMQTLSKMLGG